MKALLHFMEAAILAMVILFTHGEAARILGFFPSMAKSHHRVSEPVLRELAVRGHQVTYLTPFRMDQAPSNLTHIIIKDYMKDLVTALENMPSYMQFLPLVMGTFGTIVGENVLQDKEFQKLIASDAEFDLILSETTIFHETFAPLSHRFNAPSVEILPSSNLHWTWFLHGNPYDTSYIIDMSVAYTDRMTLKERIHNTFNSILTRFILYHCYMPKYQRMADQYFRYPGWESRPPLGDMIQNASMVLVNSHYSVNYPYPQASNFKDIGGINIQPETKPLSKELKEFMDGAKDGVIYFTLGSVNQVSTVMSGELSKVFSKVFGGLKQRVLWKWESEFPGLPQNIMISKWFPQQDVLAHKNIKLFITHGGFLSQTESVYNGVPMIGIPLMADQHKNIKHMEAFGYGIPLYLENITEHSLSWAINHVLSNPGFAENARKRSAIFKDKPQTGLETAVYWIEYVLRHKGAHHLRPAIADMPWYQQAMLDVYSAMAAIVLIPMYITYKIFSCLCRCLCRKSKGKHVDDKRKKE